MPMRNPRRSARPRIRSASRPRKNTVSGLDNAEFDVTGSLRVQQSLDVLYRALGCHVLDVAAIVPGLSREPVRKRVIAAMLRTRQDRQLDAREVGRKVETRDHGGDAEDCAD
jgi:hypothetical protein